MKNDYCDAADLTNEASVETRIVDPLLKDLGYPYRDIALKTSIREFKVGKGSKSEYYKPDYIIKVDGIPAVVIDAKAPDEDITKWEQQCSSYCLEINKSYDYNPVQYFVLSSGMRTSLYEWDRRQALVMLSFEQLCNGNSAFAELKNILEKQAIVNKAQTLKRTLDESLFEFGPIQLGELSTRFRRMHQYIWSKDKKSPSAAFEELIKVVFVKIQKDKEIHSKLGVNPKPHYADVVFSSHWISSQSESDNPINDPLFRNLVRSLEADIQAGVKKRIFDTDAEINLSPDTIRWIVREIQHVDFAAMEDDIHGRMFESFLEATARGSELGQFFTPRDVVDLMVELADIKVNKSEVENVLDACCGSGGFLISSMRLMSQRAAALVGLSNQELEKIQNIIRNDSLFGIDAGSDPAIYRIARMNMYLHGDGGSHIYFADALDKTLGSVGKPGIEENNQLAELRTSIIDNEKRFNVILSNPPFSLKYSRTDAYQAAILNQYDVALCHSKGKILNSLLSSVMFLERYNDLVAANGRILAVIDESILSGESYCHIRDYIRSKFIIVGVISLPGDAFHRAAARVKTSVMILRLRQKEETQPDAYMVTATVLGLEEKVAKRIGVDVKTLRQQKLDEAKKIVKSFNDFKAGKSGSYVVPASRMIDRLDPKFCINDRGRKKSMWVKKGLKTTALGVVLALQKNRSIKVSPADSYQFLRVSYGGEVFDGDLIDGADCSYSKLQVVETWDVLLSNMGVGRGALGIVPPYHNGKYVSSEFTILRAGSSAEAIYYSNLMRSKEILGDILIGATGMNRGRIKWQSISSVEVPQYSNGNTQVADMLNDIEEFWRANTAFQASPLHMSTLATDLAVDGADAHSRWLGLKPPE